MLAPLTELFRYRELIRLMVARDLKVRYRNSVLGFIWCLLNPLLMTAVFTFVFSILMGNKTIKDYPVFLLVGILAWNFHQVATMQAVGSIVANSGLVMKVYFPREVLPISVVFSNAVNFVLALIALFALIFAYHIPLSMSLLLLPIILIVQLVFASGIALILAAVTVFYRDVEIIMETILLAWFFLTPIFYRMQDVFPAYTRLMYILNPMASIIAAYRNVLYSGGMPAMDFLGRTFLTSVVILIVGYIFFQRTTTRFAEEL